MPAALFLTLNSSLAFLALGIVIVIDGPVGFWADNALPPPERFALLGFVMTGGIVGLSAAIVIAARDPARGFDRVAKLARRTAPLSLLWSIVALSTNYVWQEDKLDFLLLLGGTGLLLERALWVSGLTFPRYLIDGLSERYSRIPAGTRRVAPLLIVILCATAFTSYMGYWAVTQHHRLATASFDLAILDNVAFNLKEGQGFRATILYGPAGGTLLAGHSSFILYLLLPFYSLAPRTETLLIIQSVLLGFAAVPLYAFSATQLPRWSAALVAIAYLLYTPMHGPVLYDFHCLPLCVFFLFALFWAIATRRTGWMWIIWLVCISIREDVPIGLATLGLFLAWTGYRTRTGVLLAVSSAAAFLAIKFVIMPLGGSWFFADLYGQLMPEGMKGYGGVLVTLATNPAHVFSTLLTEPKLIYGLDLLAPLVFLPLRRWAYLWLLAGAFALTMLSTSYAPVTSMAFHYTAHWIPYVFGASVLALASMGTDTSGATHRHAAVAALLVCVTLHSLAFGAVLRPNQFRAGNRVIPFEYSDQEKKRYADLRGIVAMIPDDASVAATDPEAPHISNRNTAYALRMGAGDADYLLIREFVQPIERRQAQFTLDEHPYGLVAHVGDFYLFGRGATSSATAPALESVGLKPGQPEATED